MEDLGRQASLDTLPYCADDMAERFRLEQLEGAREVSPAERLVRSRTSKNLEPDIAASDGLGSGGSIFGGSPFTSVAAPHAQVGTEQEIVPVSSTSPIGSQSGIQSQGAMVDTEPDVPALPMVPLGNLSSRPPAQPAPPPAETPVVVLDDPKVGQLGQKKNHSSSKSDSVRK